MTELMPNGYRGQGEQVLLFQIEASAINCQHHIPRKIGAARRGCSARASRRSHCRPQNSIGESP